MQHVETAAKVSVPAEWAPQKAIWTAWPADADEWNGDLEAPRRDVAALVHALRAPQRRTPARQRRRG